MDRAIRNEWEDLETTKQGRSDIIITNKSKPKQQQQQQQQNQEKKHCILNNMGKGQKASICCGSRKRVMTGFGEQINI